MTTPKICTKTFKLNTGAEIPALGLGTWKCTDEECYNAVITALNSGYKHIDTARVYQNEEAVGNAIHDYLIKTGKSRDELFITTKLWCNEFEDPETALTNSLKRLRLDYVDLYLQHWPFGIPFKEGELMPLDKNGNRLVLSYEECKYNDIYKKLQPLIEKGLTKSIGISNYNIPKIEKLLNDPEVKIIPSCNQIEIHPYLPQIELIEYCKSKGILVECYSPLGSTGAPVLKDDIINKIAKKYNVSPACIVLSWGIDRGTVVLPKSVNPSRIESNLKTIDLEPDEIKLIEDIGVKNPKRVNNPKWGISTNIFAESESF